MEYKVGRPKIKMALVETMIIIAMGIAHIVWSPWVEMKCFGYLLILITLCVVFPGISYCELMWTVNQEDLRYTYHNTFLDKICSFFRQIIKTGKLEYQMTIYLKQIDYIAVTYAKLPRAPYGMYGYDVLFEVHMLDGSLLTFQSLTLSGRKDFNKAVEFMKKQGIVFVDRYKILEVLQGEQELSYYLERLEKEHD